MSSKSAIQKQKRPEAYSVHRCLEVVSPRCDFAEHNLHLYVRSMCVLFRCIAYSRMSLKTLSQRPQGTFSSTSCDIWTSRRCFLISSTCSRVQPSKGQSTSLSTGFRLAFIMSSSSGKSAHKSLKA
ncbi:hypothetical protein BDN72DRAFT_383452 [Pluteus cervinus]|uniref:Uncharacterized protein n=1 Tax=Pluteus cervinus TaxID=181527 RepID=A0ACD3A9T0_9AGAR|nr:hypothetical protein BDN72DRAFT_383452 [Pluteus cervinus]